MAQRARQRNDSSHTPMMRQYLALKEQVPDCILFFRMGDFYEMFLEDARVASRVLQIALTSRDKNQDNPIPMCGVPYHAKSAYLAKLVEAGHKVAICDQVEDPRAAKGLVRREITQVVSPGTVVDPDLLSAKDHCFLAALFLGRGGWGLAHLDLASGEFKATGGPPGPSLAQELGRLEAAELVVAESQAGLPALAELGGQVGELLLTRLPGRPPTLAAARRLLAERAPQPAGEPDEAALVAAALAWQAACAARRQEPGHVEVLELYRVESHLVLDHSARRNLEIFRSLAHGGRAGSLMGAVDRTATAMGGRLLREWLAFPLLEQGPIEERHQAVEELSADPVGLEDLARMLGQLPDLPRLVGRAALGSAGPRDLAALREALDAMPALAAATARYQAPLIADQRRALGGLEDLAADLAATLTAEPPASLAEGGVIAPGVDLVLDQQRDLAKQGKGWIAGLQASLRAETAIPSLKVGFNKVFGYYIEVTRPHLAKVPETFIRKQTLAAAERFFTPELKEKEAAVLGAEDRAAAQEAAAFEALRERVAARARPLMALARGAAALDVLSALARLALSQDYVRPVMAPEGEMVIQAGRHPVVEQMLPPGDFVPNDLRLGGEGCKVMIITGPNMAGKSTILRQAALICLLAQAGSFVPAAVARLPLVDRIFTRVGAMDDLARGQSTFMVEMTETSQILKAATERSLVILDEVGRGTSTFDGLSIAWAVAEFLHDRFGGVKTLFATHYHELTELAASRPAMSNFNVAVTEYQGHIVFLRTLRPGGVSRSYGIQVARLAGLPQKVVERARQILARLEQSGRVDGGGRKPPVGKNDPSQMVLFDKQEHAALARLRQVDLERLTPLEALNLLSKLKDEL